MKGNRILQYSLLFYWIIAQIALVIMIYFKVTQNIFFGGITVAVALGLFDLLVSSKILNSLENSQDDKQDNTKQFAVLVYGFFIRMIIIFAGFFGFEMIEKNWGISFAITYLSLHFAHIAGFSVASMKKMKEDTSKEVGNPENKPDTDLESEN